MSILELPAAQTFASAEPALLRRPQLLASFSFDENRAVLVDDDRKDESLRWYRQPILGLDVKYGFEKCTWRPDGIDEGLDALLDWQAAALDCRI